MCDLGSEARRESAMLEEKTFTFPFREQDWGSKFLIGGLLHLIAPLVLYLPIVLPRGYSLRVWRDALLGLPPRLTGWDDWEGMGIKGLAYYGIMLLYSLPVWLAWAGVLVIVIGGGMALGLGIQAIQETGVSDLGPVLFSFLYIGLIGLASLVAVVISLWAGLVFPMAVGRYLDQDRLGAAFELGVVWRLTRANLGGLLLAWLVLLGINLLLVMVVSALSTILCWLPFASLLLAAPVSFYLSLVQARLMGQVYRDARQRLGDLPAAAAGAQPARPAGRVEEVVVLPVAEPAVPAPIAALGLAARLERVLNEAGLTTVDALLERLAEGDTALLSVRGVGRQSLAEIKRQLATGGFLD